MDKTNQEILVQAFHDHQKSLLQKSFLKVNNKELSDDLVQTTFLKTWQYLLKDGEIDSMRKFLFHVLNGLIIDEYRKNKPISLDILTEAGFQVVIDDSDRLFDILDGKTAMLMIPLLPDKYKDVVGMRYEDEMTLNEIAKLTQQSNNTVAVQIHRGIEKLAILFRVEESRSQK
ncbi:MAG: sigma-70 family RNA polymerase sigma factor [Candidatus Paceibacterota bacterium]